MHLTVGMFGDLEFFKKFGKVGTENDLLIRNHADSGNIFTYVAPNSDKIQSVIQAAAMADFPVVAVNEITAEIGEVLILLDEMGFDSGLIVTDYHEDKIGELTKDMHVIWEFISKDENKIREKILSLSIGHPKEPVLVTMDSYFPVKGVGTVVLGLVKSGKVKQYDNLTIYPTGKQVTVKSMQSQDRDVKETEPGQRIGLALKGVETGELKRGYVFSDKDIECKKEIEIEPKKSKYSKFPLEKGKRIMVSIGLQVVGAEIRSVDGMKMKLELDNPIAAYQDKIILATNDMSPRIIGSGKTL